MILGISLGDPDILSVLVCLASVCHMYPKQCCEVIEIQVIEIHI